MGNNNPNSIVHLSEQALNRLWTTAELIGAQATADAITREQGRRTRRQPNPYPELMVGLHRFISL
jgi:hypothetical protein